jgi:hypothetical protein
MQEEFGSIALTREQYRELLLVYIIGMHVRRRALGLKEEDRPDLEELERHLLSFAPGFEAEDLVARKDSLFPSPTLEGLCHEILEARDVEEFWERLGDELAWRDFLLTLPEGEREVVADSGLKPPAEFYEKYAKELDHFGADRLSIDENLPPLARE